MPIAVVILPPGLAVLAGTPLPDPFEALARALRRLHRVRVIPTTARLLRDIAFDRDDGAAAPAAVVCVAGVIATWSARSPELVLDPGAGSTLATSDLVRALARGWSATRFFFEVVGDPPSHGLASAVRRSAEAGATGCLTIAAVVPARGEGRPWRVSQELAAAFDITTDPACDATFAERVRARFGAAAGIAVTGEAEDPDSTPCADRDGPRGPIGGGPAPSYLLDEQPEEMTDPACEAAVAEQVRAGLEGDRDVEIAATAHS